jgi:hypothetical protein
LLPEIYFAIALLFELKYLSVCVFTQSVTSIA